MLGILGKKRRNSAPFRCREIDCKIIPRTCVSAWLSIYDGVVLKKYSESFTVKSSKFIDELATLHLLATSITLDGLNLL